LNSGSYFALIARESSPSQAFETEMAVIEHNGAGNGTAEGFRAFGKTYKSERDAIVSFLDKGHAAEANGALTFGNWANVCKTDCIRSGLRMIAEREAYHARIFENRLRELGAEARAVPNSASLKVKECASDPNMTDNAKLLQLNAALSNPDESSGRFSSLWIASKRTWRPKRP
jgi:hypothetical protein